MTTSPHMPRPPLDDETQRHILQSWQATVNGMHGPRAEMPPQPDNPVAHALLEAAEIALYSSRSEFEDCFDGSGVLH